MEPLEIGWSNIDKIYDHFVKDDTMVATTSFVINAFADCFVDYMEKHGIMSVERALIAFIQGMARLGIDREIVKKAVKFGANERWRRQALN